MSKKRPKVKPECRECGYYDKNMRKRYKCYVPGSCPADRRPARKEGEEKEER